MKELEFQHSLKEKLQEIIKDNKYEVKKKANLLYKVVVNENLEFEPDTPAKPSRGNYAFQTDLLIIKKENELPLVVIECKVAKEYPKRDGRKWKASFSTHDILTYSSKAQKHKEIYPFLRYGLVVGGTDVIHHRFFIHNIGFDFALALEDINSYTSLQKLARIIHQQIENAELILSVFKDKNQVQSFSTEIRIEKIT